MSAYDLNMSDVSGECVCVHTSVHASVLSLLCFNLEKKIIWEYHYCEMLSVCVSVFTTKPRQWHHLDILITNDSGNATFN